jgi:hypothetical protein
LNIHPKAGQQVAKSQSGSPLQDPYQSLQFQLSQAEIDSLKVEQIAVDDSGILFLLDNSGHVWGFSRKPIENSNVIYPLIRLPNISGIKQIAPYIALDASGNVFTWSHASDPAGPPFSIPVQYMGIQNVTSIFPESLAVEAQLDDIEDHPSISKYVVLVNNQDIFQIAIDEDGEQHSPKKIYSSNEIKSIAVSGSNKNEILQNIVVLLKDGDLLNISIPSPRRERQNKHSHRTGTLSTSIPPAVDESTTEAIQISKLGNFPSATEVSVNSAHTLLLNESGRIVYLGDCDAVEKNNDGKWISIEGVKKMESLSTDVAKLEFHSGKHDDVFSNALIKKDGSIWLDSPPSPTGYGRVRGCAEIRQVEYAKAPDQLFIGQSPPKQIYFGDRKYYVLDANHDLWGLYAYDRMYYKKLPKNQLSKIELNFSGVPQGSGAGEVYAIERAVQIYENRPTLKINVGEVRGNFARAETIPQPGYDSATVFLRKEGGDWVVTDFGTGAEPPEDYPSADVPAKKE